jgi:hypothetical protein
MTQITQVWQGCRAVNHQLSESTCGSLPTQQVLFPYYSFPEVFLPTCSPYLLDGIGNALKNTGRLLVASLSNEYLSPRPTVMAGPDPMSG